MNKRNLLLIFLTGVFFQLLIFFRLAVEESHNNLKNLVEKFSLAIFITEKESVDVVAERIRRLPLVKEVQALTAKDVLEKVRSQPTLSDLYLPEENPFSPYIVVTLQDFSVPEVESGFKNISGVNSVKYDRELYNLIRKFRKQSDSYEKRFWLIVILLFLGVLGRFVFLPVSGQYLSGRIYHFVIVLVLLLTNYLLFRPLIVSFSQFLIIFVLGLLVCLLFDQEI